MIRGYRITPPTEPRHIPTRDEESHYTPPPHVHQLDIDRSDITVTEDGSIYGHCCLAGCDEGVFLHHNMRRAWERR